MTHSKTTIGKTRMYLWKEAVIEMLKLPESKRTPDQIAEIADKLLDCFDKTFPRPVLLLPEEDGKKPSNKKA
jgi:hypothetical protein